MGKTQARAEVKVGKKSLEEKSEILQGIKDKYVISLPHVFILIA